MSRQTPRLPTHPVFGIHPRFFKRCLCKFAHSRLFFQYMPINIYQHRCQTGQPVYINLYVKPVYINIYRSGLFAQVGEREDVLEFLQNVENVTRFLFCYHFHQHHHPSDVHSIFVTLLIMISSHFYTNSCHYHSKLHLLILCPIGHYDLFWLSIRSCLAAQKSLTFQLLHIQVRKIIIFFYDPVIVKI